MNLFLQEYGKIMVATVVGLGMAVAGATMSDTTKDGVKDSVQSIFNETGIVSQLGTDEEDTKDTEPYFMYSGSKVYYCATLTKGSFNNATSYVNKLNSDKYLEHTNWRVPTVLEIGALYESNKCPDMNEYDLVVSSTTYGSLRAYFSPTYTKNDTEGRLVEMNISTSADSANIGWSCQ